MTDTDKDALIVALTKVLRFYANKNRYAYDTDRCPYSDNPGTQRHVNGILGDDGQRARAALARADEYLKRKTNA